MHSNTYKLGFISTTGPDTSKSQITMNHENQENLRSQKFGGIW